MRVGLLSEHCVSVSVRDCAALLDATAGPLPGDPFMAPAPPIPYLEETQREPGRYRILFSTETPTGAALHPDCVSAVEDAAKLCESLGHHVEEGVVRLEQDEVSDAFKTISSAGLAWDIRNWERITGKPATPDQFEVGTWALIERGRAAATTAEQLMDALAGMQAVSDHVAASLEAYDIWLTPTLGAPPPPLGSFKASPEDPNRGLKMSSQILPFTPLINITGQPAMSVPLFWNSDNLPIGVHFVGRYGNEGSLFRLAGQLESARPWATRIPPLI